MMSDSFANQTIPCPHCKELPEFTNSRFVPLLECSERNYSGCSVDIANCTECGKGYQVSYSVAEVSPVPSWDMPTRLERKEHKRKSQLEEIERKRAELTQLEAAKAAGGK